MRSSWIIGVALNLVAGVLTGNTQGETQEGRRGPGAGGRGCSNVAKAKDTRAAGSRKRQRADSPRDLWGEHGAAATLSSDSGPPELTEDMFLLFKPPGFATFYGSYWELVYLFIYPPTYLYHLISI